MAFWLAPDISTRDPIFSRRARGLIMVEGCKRAMTKMLYYHLFITYSNRLSIGAISKLSSSLDAKKSAKWCQKKRVTSCKTSPTDVILASHQRHANVASLYNNRSLFKLHDVRRTDNFCAGNTLSHMQTVSYRA